MYGEFLGFEVFGVFDLEEVESVGEGGEVEFVGEVTRDGPEEIRPKWTPIGSEEGESGISGQAIGCNHSMGGSGVG